MKVLIIIPAYNEENSIQKVISELNYAAPDIDYLIVNDCSRDSTRQICQSNGYYFASLPINLGIGGGIQTGYKYALENDYEIAVQIDGDGQHDPQYLYDLLKPIENGEADIVIGSRFLNKEKEGFRSSASRRLGIQFLSKLIRLCSGADIKDVTSGYRAVNKEYIKFYADSYPQDYPEPEAIVSAKLNGANIKEVPVVMKEREHGTSSINLKRSVYYMVKVSLAILICRIRYRRKK